MSIGMRFNPQPRVAADRVYPRANCERRRFNPQPRVAADLTNKAMAVGGAVSIHSRAWRLTVGLYGDDIAATVSIHSRAWRLT